MAKPPSSLKPLSTQEWETLMEDYQYGGSRRRRWTSANYTALPLLQLSLSSLLRKDFPLNLKLRLLVFLEEEYLLAFEESGFEIEQTLTLILDALRPLIQAPIDGVSITYSLKDQFMLSTTSIFITATSDAVPILPQLESLIELLLTVINRPNHGLDRQTRGVACECLRELERAFPCLLSEIAGHLWGLCQSERTHVAQSYVLLLAGVVHSIVMGKANVSILNTSLPLVPFNFPQFLLGENGWGKEISSSSYKELRRVMSFLLEWPQYLTPCGLIEFMSMIIPVAVALELQASLLTVQLSGLIYSFDPMLCHALLVLCSQFPDSFDGQEGEVANRLVLMSREVQHYLVFRLLALHWLLGFIGLLKDGEGRKKKVIIGMRLSFYPTVFDPLSLKSLKLDLLAYCSILVDGSMLPGGHGVLGSDVIGSGVSVVKLLEDGLVSVSGFKWLPPWSTETAVAFRTFYKFLIGASSHSDTNRILMESTIFHTSEVHTGNFLSFRPPPPLSFLDLYLISEVLAMSADNLLHNKQDRGRDSYIEALEKMQGRSYKEDLKSRENVAPRESETIRMLVDMVLEFQGLVPVIVSFFDRLFSCYKHRWLGERLLQTLDVHLLPKVKIDNRLGSYFPVFDRIAENDTVPPIKLLELLTSFMFMLVEKHGPDTGLKCWSLGSRVLGICRTMLMHHHSSRLFLGLSRLLAFTCLYFPDLEVRDDSRIYLRMLICVPGNKLKHILNIGEPLPGISPSPQSSSFFSQSPSVSHESKKSRNILSYIHFERVASLLVKQSWSLSLSSVSTGGNEPSYLEGINGNEPPPEQREPDGNADVRTLPEMEITGQRQEPLRVMDSKISEIVGILRRHFSSIPDYRQMPELKIRISCSLRFQSEPFNRIWGFDVPASTLDEEDILPAIYATVLTFSSSAPYGAIPSCHIPFLLGEPPKSDYSLGQSDSFDIVSVENGTAEEYDFKAPVMVELEPQEPIPGLVDVYIETNAENGQVIRGQLQSLSVGIEDMFLQAIMPEDVPPDAVPGYYLDLFSALWEACGTSSSTGRETFLLKGGKGTAAIRGTRSVKLVEVPATSLIQAVERHLAAFVVSVIGEPLVNIVKDGGIIRDIIWKDVSSDSAIDVTTSDPNSERAPLYLKYHDDEDEGGSQVHFNKKEMGCFLILIFLPPRFHLLFQMEVCDVSTLVRIRTDHWPCLAYIDDYLEALFYV
ncbi:hypothetical protein RJ640_009900 [Escallonia rubra]|uniref:Adaptor-related protein complex 5 beta subunit n=1 Tax=Escallonia rubra TaxID=112253 RepID=A0AA88UBK9_9ASTE|nr:hypothetical protein RJ640_009900 [Escallonia rubra]